MSGNLSNDQQSEGRKREPNRADGAVPWFLTTTRQIKGYKRELNRIDEALSRQDVRGVGSPLTRLRGSLSISLVGGVLVLVAAFVVSLINPKPDSGVAAIMTTRSGGIFVQFNGRLHPVTNLASARLIVGTPEEAKVATDTALRSLPTGPLMGIPSAPNLLSPRTDESAVWTVCDWRDTAVPLSLLKTGDITTAVIAGDDMLDGGTDLGSNRAVLVKPASDPTRLWLLYRDTRAEVGRGDYAAQAALGLTPSLIETAVTVSPSLLATIAPSPVLTAPRLVNQGQPSPTVNGSAIGDVLTVATASGSRAFYLVGSGGVQQVSPVLAQMMINTGAAQKLVDDPASVQAMPRVGIVDDSRFPTQVPTLVSEPALCWSWTKSAGELTAHTRIFTNSRMPVTESGRVAAVHLLPNNGSTDQATDSITRPGYGWYARTTGDSTDSVAAEQLLWIDPNGTRFPIDVVIARNGAVSYDPTVKALGFDSISPTPIPAAVAKLYAPGATLSIKNAQVMQGTINPASQVPNPPTTQGQPPPAPVPEEEGEAPAPDATTPDPAASSSSDTADRAQATNDASTVGR
ncbi:type VII secretion protein EccB [Mycobacteroides abscessus]|uniref:type VII secretion protein EccB n=1 Tax=Mycobacteroides abscessus TaxID=36809 RepID=UPI0005E8D5C6|nr:type VII secretion protein EccB [Mycobacteroides abscessus]CPW92653.1 type VII secretion protein EccB%2C Actinobacterial [Mycobacteroides abscessus]SKF41299.1 type VII secretion protein EccB, Actinobacterial [Mycobacteroides abscessus subsp. bolletii]SKH18783.1 type VII secretion protein EccB, Actinobacterial [Mycobacteroides abscessus subsp. bolletii]